MKHRKTFAEIVAETAAIPTPEPTTSFGVFDEAGDLWDPAGHRLHRVKAEITPAQARKIVREGGQLAWESCGCGGWQGCQPIWVSQAARAQLGDGPKPRFTNRYHSPTWIDLWAGDAGRVVLAHGDVAWGDALRP